MREERRTVLRPRRMFAFAGKNTPPCCAALNRADSEISWSQVVPGFLSKGSHPIYSSTAFGAPQRRGQCAQVH
jgi:hypothetical protein